MCGSTACCWGTINGPSLSSRSRRSDLAITRGWPSPCPTWIGTGTSCASHAVYWPASLLSAAWTAPAGVWPCYPDPGGPEDGKSLGNRARSSRASGALRPRRVRWYLLRDSPLVMNGASQQQRSSDLVNNGPGQYVGNVCFKTAPPQWPGRWFDNAVLVSAWIMADPSLGGGRGYGPGSWCLLAWSAWLPRRAESRVATWRFAANGYSRTGALDRIKQGDVACRWPMTLCPSGGQPACALPWRPAARSLRKDC